MRRLLYAAITVFGIALDQWVKAWAKQTLPSYPNGSMPIIQDVFHLTYVENRGAAFGILQNQRWFLLALTGVVALVMVYILFFKRPLLAKMPGIPIAFLLAGAVGNMIDRAANSFVVDLFEARFIGFAVFNVADMFVVCSVITIALWMVWSEWRQKKQVRLYDDLPDRGAD